MRSDLMVGQCSLHPALRPAIHPLRIGQLELAERHGLLTPIVVRRVADRFEILSEPDSWLLARRLQLAMTPATILDGIDDAEALDIVHASRSSESPIARARRLVRLREQEQATGGRGALERLARRTGLSRSEISHATRLLKLPPLIQEAIAVQALNVGHARALLRIDDTNAQCDLALRIINERWSVRRTERHVRSVINGVVDIMSSDADIRRLERRLTEQLGSPVSIDQRAGALTIAFGGNTEVFAGILDRLGYQDD